MDRRLSLKCMNKVAIHSCSPFESVETLKVKTIISIHEFWKQERHNISDDTRLSAKDYGKTPKTPSTRCVLNIISHYQTNLSFFVYKENIKKFR